MTTPARPRDVAGVRLVSALTAPRDDKRAALMPYVTGGFPDRAACGRAVAAFIAAGADIVELGVPYSDPVADGPVVQASAHAALTQGVTTDDVFDVAAAHSREVPFVLLAYVNTVLAYGLDLFFHQCFLSGVAGVVIPDLPADEADPFIDAAEGHGVALVLLAAPTSSDARLDLIAAKAKGFIYCVAVTGVTGARVEQSDELPELVARLRARTRVPLVAGFGISTPEQAARAGELCDGVIMGSAVIRLLAEASDVDEGIEAAGRLLRSSAAALSRR